MTRVEADQTYRNLPQWRPLQSYRLCRRLRWLATITCISVPSQKTTCFFEHTLSSSIHGLAGIISIFSHNPYGGNLLAYRSSSQKKEEGKEKGGNKHPESYIDVLKKVAACKSVAFYREWVGNSRCGTKPSTLFLISPLYSSTPSLTNPRNHILILLYPP